ncbi:hypothetical protein [Ornithinimicrobium murale]|uniref:hypothetical protein n=1 Tax=Ornithinimicrobium murale TaxID=1050153 RepID=UPI000E0CC1B0|nr:hypothetical protein [Ornithinimicrobium murale]
MSVATGIVLAMSLSTRQDLAEGVAKAITSRRPDLADNVALVEELTVPAVRMMLTNKRCILFVRARENHLASWVIATPDGHVVRVAEPGGVGAVASLMIAAYLRFAETGEGTVS